MPANVDPIFVLTPFNEVANLTTANANRDGTGALVTAVTAGANGARVHKIVVQALVTTTLGMVRIFLGTSLWLEIPVAANTASASVPAVRYEINLMGEKALILKAGQVVAASTEKSEAINVYVEGGHF